MRAVFACKADGMPLGSLDRELLLQMHRVGANLHETGCAAHECKLLSRVCAEGALLEPPTPSGRNGRDPVAHVDGSDSFLAGTASSCTMLQKADSMGGVLSMFSPQMRAILRQRCSRPGDYFHCRSWNGKEAAKKADWTSTIFSASPITLAYSKWKFRLFWIGIICFLAWLVLRPEFGPLSKLLSDNRVTGRIFRFEVTELRAGKGVPSSKASIGALFLMDNGCKVSALESSIAQEGSILHLTGRNGTVISANGFSFYTSSSPSDVDYDPVGFVFSFCSNLSAVTPADCPPEKWHVVGSAQCLFTWSSLQCFPVKAGKFMTSQERGAEHVFDLRSPPFHSFCVIGRLGCYIVGFSLSMLISSTGHYNTARVARAAIVYFLNGIVNGILYAFVNFLNFYGTRQAWTSIFPLAFGLVMIGWGVCLAFYEHRLFSRFNGYPSWLEFVIIWFACILPLEGILLYGGGTSSDWWFFTMANVAQAEIYVLLVFYLFIRTFKWWARRQALLSVQPDQEQYDQEWKSLLAAPGTQEALDELAELVRQFEKSGTAKAQTAVQMLVESPSSVSIPPFFRGALAVCLRSNKVACLDQLYLQAHLVWPVCVKLVHVWARSSGGLLMTDHTSTLQATSAIDLPHALSHAHTSPSSRHSIATTGAVGAETEGDLSGDVVFGKRRWDGFLSLVSVDPQSGWGGLCSWNHVKISGQRARIKWAGIKNPTRAIEKVHRVYSKDVSRLVDVVRQTIVFDRLGELATCLRAVLHDPQVALSRARSLPRCLARLSCGCCRPGLERASDLIMVVAMPTMRVGAGQVKVLRVKNRYSEDLKGGTTGGYRGERLHFSEQRLLAGLGHFRNPRPPLRGAQIRVV